MAIEYDDMSEIEGEAEYSASEDRLTLQKIMQEPNLLALLEGNVVSRIAMAAKAQYERDKTSREDWLRCHDKAMDLALQISKGKTYPFNEASNVIYPLITTASIQFAARAYPAIVSGRNVIKTKIVGDDSGQFFVPMDQDGQPAGEPQQVVAPGEKANRADRVSRWMNNQLLEQEPDWESDTDQLLHYLPIAGCAFRKRWWDNGPRSKFVPASSLVINMGATSLETAPQVTEEFELYPHEIIARANRGVYDEDAVEKVVKADDEHAVEMLECHCRYDLDEDGYPEPYVVTMTKDGGIFRITNNFGDMEMRGEQVIEIKPRAFYVKYPFIPNPDGGFYDIGFGWLLGPINEAINTAINQLNDAAHWQNAPSYFVGKGVRLKQGDTSLRPNEMKPVDAFGADLKNEIVKVEAGTPSSVTFNLLTLMLEAGKDIASVKDILMGGGANQNLAPTTALTLAEQGMKSFTAIFKRVHRALKKEVGLLYMHNMEHVDEIAELYAMVLDQDGADPAADFDDNYDIVPVTDPDMVSDGVKMARNQFLMGLAQTGLLNPGAVVQRVLEAANIENPEELAPQPQGPSVDDQVKMMKVENDRMRVMTAIERSRAEIIEMRASAREKAAKARESIAGAVLALAKAESEEVGQQLEQYKAQLSGLEMMDQIYNAALNDIGGVRGMVAGPGDNAGLQGPQGQGGPAGAPLAGPGVPQSAPNAGGAMGLPPGQGAGGGPSLPL